MHPSVLVLLVALAATIVPSGHHAARPHTAPLLAPDPVGGLRIIVEGLQSDAGSVRIALFNSEETFTRTPLRAEVLPIRDRRAVWTVHGLAPGHYAAAAFHDEDADGDVDRGLFGIPREPYGFTRGARGRFGPPAWDDARVEVGSGTTFVRIPMR